MKIAFITDIHFRQAVPGASPVPARKCREMAELLPRAFEATAKEKPDLLICTGDLVDDPSHPNAVADLEKLREWFGAFPSPQIILPGNHDPEADRFYQTIPRPEKKIQIGGVEFLNFWDDFRPAGEEARVRPKASLREMEAALSEIPIGNELTILSQHYLIYPERNEGYPHNYGNDREIRAILEKSPRRLLNVSGHFHSGVPLCEEGGVSYFVGRAFCEKPHPFYLFEILNGEIKIREAALEARP
ncbi:MAG: metallophosphoesterase [Spirochaetia bacterium]|nr:metallophosphoesterase [Spirochaetia bacterium]